MTPGHNSTQKLAIFSIAVLVIVPLVGGAGVVPPVVDDGIFNNGTVVGTQDNDTIDTVTRISTTTHLVTDSNSSDDERETTLDESSDANSSRFSTAAVGDPIDNTTHNVTGTVDNTTTSATGLVDNAAGGTTDLVDGTVNTTTSTVDNTTESTTAVVNDTSDSTTDLADNTTDSTTDLLNNTTDSATTLADNTTNSTKILDNTTDSTTDLVNNTTDSTTGLVDNTTDDTTDLVDNTTDSTTDLATNTTDSTTDLVNNTSDSTTDLVDNTTDGTTDLVDNTTDSTTDLVNNTTDGTTDLVDNTTDDTTDLVDNTSDSTTDLVDNTTDSTTRTPVDGQGETNPTASTPVSDSGSNSETTTDNTTAPIEDTTDNLSVPPGDRSRPRVANEGDNENTEQNASTSNGAPFVPPPSPETGLALGAVVVAAGVVIKHGGVVAGVVSNSAATTGTGMFTTVRSVLSNRLSDPFSRVFALFRYSRYDDSDPLEHTGRKRVFETVVNTPGVHLSAVDRRTGLSLSTIRHHLRVLEQESLVMSVKVHGKRRFYPAYSEQVELTAALNDEATANVIHALFRLGPASVSALAADLDRDPSTVTHHLQRLEDDGIIVRERDGRTMMNRLAPEVRRVLSDGVALDDAVSTTPLPSSAD